MVGDHQRVTSKRWWIDVLLFICVFIMPWWLVAMLSLVGLLYFENFFEIILLGLAMDAAYRVTGNGFWHFELTATIFSMIVFIAATFAKKHLNLFNQ